jgi:hypothetical protein
MWSTLMFLKQGPVLRYCINSNELYKFGGGGMFSPSNLERKKIQPLKLVRTELIDGRKVK